jgi:hypothetical protein
MDLDDLHARLLETPELTRSEAARVSASRYVDASLKPVSVNEAMRQ